MIDIYKKGEESIPLIRQLTLQVWPQTYAPVLTPEQIHYMLNLIYSTESLQKQIREGQQFIFAYDQGEPVAFASYSQNHGEPNVYKLHKLYCLPNTQGRGIGKKLVEFISQEVRSTGATELELNVNRYNPAKSFYEKLGFAVAREEDIDIGNGYFMNDYVMRKKI